MNNQERIQARISRDKARKNEGRKLLLEKHGTFENVITMQNLLHSLQKRRKNVEWKGSVQTYIAHGIVKMKRSKDSLWSGNMNVNRTIRQMTLYERGKRRNIHAIMIDSRVIQGAICDNSITPLTQPSLIYDNPASTKGKGVSHARGRMSRHIEVQIKKNGTDFFVLVYDFSGFFDSIAHSLCRDTLKDAGQDDMLLALTMHFIKMYQEQDISLLTDEELKAELSQKLINDEGIGATLGSQISQDMALATPNKLDHTIKDKEGMKHYIRYMDDGIILHKSKAFLQRFLNKIKAIANKLGLKLNEKKTRIVKSSRGFNFLKVRYIITDTGRIIRKMAKSGIVRMRRKLKKFRKLVDAGVMLIDDVYNSFKSWFGNAKKIAQSYRARKSMLILYNKLFHRYRTGGMIA